MQVYKDYPIYSKQELYKIECHYYPHYPDEKTET